MRRPTDGESSVETGGTPGVVVGELDDAESETLDVSTGSSRSTVASEKTDVGVMLKKMSTSQVLALGLCEEFICGCTNHQHCMPLVGAGDGCGEASDKFGVSLFKVLCRSKTKFRSLIGPKYG